MPPEVSPTAASRGRPESNPRERYAVATEGKRARILRSPAARMQQPPARLVFGGHLRLGASFIQIPKTSLGTARAPFLCKRNEESDIGLFSCREKSSCPFRASCGSCALLSTTR